MPTPDKNPRADAAASRITALEENFAFAERTIELLSQQMSDLLTDLTRLRTRVDTLERERDHALARQRTGLAQPGTATPPVVDDHPG